MAQNLPIVIVKIGTNLLTTAEGVLDLHAMRHFVSVISASFLAKTHRMMLVTSGSITCGSRQMGMVPRSIPDRQAAASVGQILLMTEYSLSFLKYGITVGQILLTKDGFENDLRKHHAKNTIFTLLDYGVIPIINENDSVSTDEIGQKFGDNDQLSASVAELVRAKTLILLTDTDGVFTRNPKLYDDAELISKIECIDESILMGVEDVDNGRSRGGMKSKLLAAKRASDAGVDVYIANGRKEGVLSGLLAGDHHGTFICRQD